MKKGIVLLVMLVFALALSAQTSIAATDNFMAAKVNPAAMGVGNNDGMTFLGNYDENGFYEDDYSLFFNFDNFAYVLDQYGKKSSHRHPWLFVTYDPYGCGECRKCQEQFSARPSLGIKKERHSAALFFHNTGHKYYL